MREMRNAIVDGQQQGGRYYVSEAMTIEGTVNKTGLSLLILIACAALRWNLPPPGPVPSGWAELIRRVYEVDPLVCPRCGGEMRAIGLGIGDSRPEIVGTKGRD